MKVVVCIKQIRYLYHPLAFAGRESSINPDKMVFMLNPYDEIAMEAAVRIKEHYEDCEIIVITAGPPMSEEALRYAFATGGDKMIRIELNSNDPRLIATALAEKINDLQCDLILCGKKSLDYNSGQVGSFLAEKLDLPQVSGIVKLEIIPYKNMAVVDRYLGRGDRQRVECRLPALFTVEDGLNDPRYPILSKRLLAEQEEIEVVEEKNQDQNLDEKQKLWEALQLSPPRPKPKRIFIPDSKLSAKERMQLIMSGGISKKENKLLQGDSRDIARKIVDVLEKENAM